MSGQQARTVSRPSSASGTPPDINAETYPFARVQELLDRAAYFNLYSCPDPGRCDAAVAARSGPPGVIGFQLDEVLHRFLVTLAPPAGGGGLRASNQVGEPVARFCQRWMLVPPNFVARPGCEPPPTLLDPSRTQRFVMLDGVCTFRGERDGFRGFGTGRTFPSEAGGRPCLLAAAVGTIVAGFGRFAGLEGTYTYCGRLDPQRGFVGSLLCRVVDPDGRLRDEHPLPPPGRGPTRELGVTYVVFRGQKRDPSEKTAYIYGPDGQVNGLKVAQELRAVHVDCAGDADGPRAALRVGEVIGSMTARIGFNLFRPGAPGTAAAPIPFRSYNEYTFGQPGGPAAGGFAADGDEGRTFRLALTGLPGQAALRFGGFGPLLRGTGAFRRIRGLMTDNSVVGIAPHALATFYVLRIDDPEGRFCAVPDRHAGGQPEGWGPSPPLPRPAPADKRG